MYFVLVDKLGLPLLQMGPTDAAFWWDVVTRLGLPFALVLFALITGARKGWYFGHQVEHERGVFAERLVEKEKEIAAWKAAAQADAATAQESIQMLREVIEALTRIEAGMGKRKRQGD